MTKSEFKKHIIVSSLLTVVAIAVIISFCVIMFDKYSKPSEDNTSVLSGTVADVYYASGKDVTIVEMSDGEQFHLVCPWLPKDLYNAIGYDLDQLAELLEGQKVEYRKMDKLPWVVEIYINDIVIDNNKMTSEEIDTAYVGIVIIGLIMLAFPVCGEVEYIKAKHKIYKKAEKKRVRSAKRKANKLQNS
ncbi:MAG: hypothetical protein E7646_05455 [Ruminococcaceae bacterium]|nr:hypothetical protein [Oscillospiraceae bacterium]